MRRKHRRSASTKEFHPRRSCTAPPILLPRPPSSCSPQSCSRTWKLPQRWWAPPLSSPTPRTTFYRSSSFSSSVSPIPVPLPCAPASSRFSRRRNMAPRQKIRPSTPSLSRATPVLEPVFSNTSLPLAVPRHFPTARLASFFPPGPCRRRHPLAHPSAIPSALSPPLHFKSKPRR